MSLSYLLWIMVFFSVPIVYFAKKGVSKPDILAMTVLFLLGVAWDYVAFNVVNAYNHVSENIIGAFLWGLPVEEYVFAAVISPNVYAAYKLLLELFRKLLGEADE